MTDPDVEVATTITNAMQDVLRKELGDAETVRLMNLLLKRLAKDTARIRGRAA